MLLTITSTARSATDLGYLLHKNPARVQSVDLSFGKAHIFYPEVSPDRCTAALLLDVDPIGLVRGGGMLDQYVNDRPYVASSFLSVAIAQSFQSALAGRSKERPDLAAQPLPLEVTVHVIPCRGGEEFLRRLFEPLGYRLTIVQHPLDEKFPEWGEGPYFTITLAGEVRLCDLLAHIYVLIPVLDAEKHYFVGVDEVEKLLRHGEGWLAAHPEREAIAYRYLKRRRELAQEALARLAEEDVSEDDGEEPDEPAVERPLRLHDQRIGTVVATLKSAGAKRILDLGCGEAQLLKVLLADRFFDEIAGMDVAYRSLERAKERLHWERMPEVQQRRVKLFQGSLTYRDRRLAGYDAAVVMEVIEHLDPPRLAAFERVLFESAQPGTVLVTTPNVEYNAKFPTLPAGQFRHKDHRFEWSRAEFERWADGVAGRFGYSVRFVPIGTVDSEAGAPTQMGVFTRVSP